MDGAKDFAIPPWRARDPPRRRIPNLIGPNSRHPPFRLPAPDMPPPIIAARPAFFSSALARACNKFRGEVVVPADEDGGPILNDAVGPD